MVGMYCSILGASDVLAGCMAHVFRRRSSGFGQSSRTWSMSKHNADAAGPRRVPIRLFQVSISQGDFCSKIGLLGPAAMSASCPLLEAKQTRYAQSEIFRVRHTADLRFTRHFSGARHDPRSNAASDNQVFPLKPRQDVPRGATVWASDTIAREATEANATFNRMVAEFRDSPPQRLERDRAELERMSNDPHFQNALAPGHQGAKTKLTAVNARIATAEQELAKLHAVDRIETAFTGDPAKDPLIDSTVGDELPMRALRTVVADGKEKNIPTPIVQEQLLPNSNDPRVKAEARRKLEELSTDPEWQGKIARGDKATVDQFRNLSLAARASADEPPWSLPFYGRATA